MEEAVAAFKKFKGIFFMLEPEQRLSWFKDDSTKLPSNKISGGMMGRPPARTFSPYDIKCVECTKPGLFRSGTFTAYGMDGKVLFQFAHKYKENCANAEQFNHYLELYRSFNLPK